MRNLTTLIICLSVFGFTTPQKQYITPAPSALHQLRYPPQQTREQKNQEEILENQRRIIQEQRQIQQQQERMMYEQERQKAWDWINQRNR